MSAGSQGPDPRGPELSPWAALPGGQSCVGHEGETAVPGEGQQAAQVRAHPPTTGPASCTPICDWGPPGPSAGGSSAHGGPRGGQVAASRKAGRGDSASRSPWGRARPGGTRQEEPRAREGTGEWNLGIGVLGSQGICGRSSCRCGLVPGEDISSACPSTARATAPLLRRRT